MTDSNHPDSGTATEAMPTFEDGVEAISDLIADPQEADPDTDEGQTAEGETAEGEDVTDEADDEPTDDDPEATEVEDDAEGEEADDPDTEPESSGGRFVAKDAKVRLEDGTVVTVGELTRNNLFQADYTRKTQEVAETRKRVEAKEAELDGFAGQLQQQRDFLLHVAQQVLPQKPDPSMIDEDIIGYQRAMAEYDAKMQMIGGINQQIASVQQQQQAIMQQRSQERLHQEAEKIALEMPELKNPQTYQKFWGDTVDMMTEYGFTTDELDTAIDHRFFRVFKDLQKYRKAIKTAPKVQEKVKTRPPLKAGKRMDVKQKSSRSKQANSDQLRKTGTMEAGVAALMDFDL